MAEDFTVVYIISFLHSYNITQTHTHRRAANKCLAHVGYQDLSEHQRSLICFPELVEVSCEDASEGI